MDFEEQKMAELKKCPQCGRFLYKTQDKSVVITGINKQTYESRDIIAKCKCGYEETFNDRWWGRYLP